VEVQRHLSAIASNISDGGRSVLGDVPRSANGLILRTWPSSVVLMSAIAGSGLLVRPHLIDEKLAAVIERPLTSDHLGGWIAAQVFDIELAPASTRRSSRLGWESN
jgi:hypothetical protein